MAKVRVYELAKELDMKSKDLVEKLIDGGLDIRNYMSTLDDEMVQRAREIATGGVSVVVEEKRVKSTVIRRRRKRIAVAPEAETVEHTGKKEEKTLEAPMGPVDAETKDMKLSGTVEKEIEATDDYSSKGLPEETVETEEEAIGIKGGIQEKKVKSSEPQQVDAKQKKEAEAGEAKALAPRAKKVTAKKEERAAKIISRPEEGPLKNILKNQEVKEAVADIPLRPIPFEEIVEKSKEVEKKKPVKKKDKKRAEKKELTPKGTFKRLKLEVYEREDLYDGARPSRREIRKGAKAQKETARKTKQTEITTPKAIKRRIKVQEFITVAELAKAMGIKAAALIKKMIGMGVVANINQAVDFETAAVVADDFGYELELDVFDERHIISDTEDRVEDLEARPPVVTIMGHVDHGKTSLLDYIRKSNVISRESGGITQHIGAYYVETSGGDMVFLDTPGHEAFTAMRARGAELTDIIVLVVAADDGVMPQTKEAINHARAADIPIIVAINKIDKPNADPDKVRRELAELNLTPEEWGGETLYGLVSAKTGEGIDDLLGIILLQAELLELKGNPAKMARGAVIEAKLDKNKGPVATVLIKNGSLKKGAYFVCGDHFGRVRAMTNHRGRHIEIAGPSVPVEIYGISGVPMAGDEFVAVKDEKTAKQIVEHRKQRSKAKDITKKGRVSLGDIFEKIKEGESKELKIILKADVQGSLEALEGSLVKQDTEEVKTRIIHSATGAITESDVMLAAASGAIVIGFNVRANQQVLEIAEREGVDIRYYSVIYDVTKDIRSAMTGLLEPVYEEHVVGHADVKEIFHVPKVGVVAGCLVSDGHVERNANVRLLRDNVVVFDGKIASLKRFKEDAKEVQTGYECGIGLENFNDIKPGDVIEVYQIDEIKPEL